MLVLIELEEIGLFVLVFVVIVVEFVEDLVFLESKSTKFRVSNSSSIFFGKNCK